jgi:hypothetical protein
MSSLQSMTRCLAISAATALLGVSCAPSGGPANGGDDANTGEGVGSGQEAYGGWGGGGGCGAIQDGLYCGGDQVSGNINTLYRCLGGQLSVYQICPAGCQVNPPGTADRCF